LSDFRFSKHPTRHPPQVVIIGASTAGLFAAYLLAKGGVPVLLFEQQEELDTPARTLIITQRIKDVLGCVPSSAIVNQTPNLQLFSSGRSTTIRLSQPDWIVERQKLIQMLARQARAAGAQILPGYRFLGLEPDHDGVVVHLQSSTGRQAHVPTRTLLGADGVFSQVAKANEQRGQKTAFVLQATVALPSGAKSDTTQVWFDPHSTRYFYWLIPESRQRAVVGLAADDERQARESLLRFLSCHKLEPLGYQGAQVALYSRNGLPWKRISGARIFLVGDAAAQVKMTTVGGVVAGLRGARAVAQAILRGSDYGRELSALRRKLELHWLMRRVLNGFGPSDYDELLGLVNARAHSVLSTRTRDDISRALLLSLLVQPRFLLLAARRFPWRDGHGLDGL